MRIRLRERDPQTRRWTTQLDERYATAAILPRMLAIVDKNVGKWACAIQEPALAYLLRVDAVAARSRIALTALPAVLPICGFASWTGWIAFDEFDLVVLGAVVGGHFSLIAYRIRHGKAASGHGQAGTLAILFLTLFSASLGFSLWIGFSADPAYSASLFDGYFSGLNSVRIAKPFALMLLMMPVVQHQIRIDEAGTLRAFAAGVLLCQRRLRLPGG